MRLQASDPFIPTDSSVATNSSTVSQDTSGTKDLGPDSPEGVTPIMQGPLHEAFAEQFSQDPQEPAVIAEKPPELIDEQPPEYEPDGEDVQWIPGYWGWDVQAQDYVWVSGIWRQVPPGERWIPGYWAATDDGWQWVSGFWNNAEDEEVTYLPEPPESLENGPNGFAPEENSFWIAGSWHYENGNYTWQSGSWAPSRPNEIWVTDRYVWTPSGYIYRPGYWDYAMVDRGTLFCPVLFQPGYQQVYTPNYFIDIGPAWFANLFVAPGLNHYYYGNYYGYTGSYSLYPWLAYQQRSNQYDGMYTYFACQQRNADWLQQLGGLQRQYQSNQRVYASRTTVAACLQQQNTFASRGYAHRGLHVASLQNFAHHHDSNINNPFHYHRMNSQTRHDQQASVGPVRQFEHQRRDHEHVGHDQAGHNHTAHHHASHSIASGAANAPSTGSLANNHVHPMRIKPTPGNGLTKHPRIPDLSKASGVNHNQSTGAVAASNQSYGHHGFGSSGHHHLANEPQGKADLNAIRQMNLQHRANIMQHNAALGQSASSASTSGHHGHASSTASSQSAQSGSVPQANPQLDAIRQFKADSQSNSSRHSHRSRMATAQHNSNTVSANTNPQTSSANPTAQSSSSTDSSRNHRTAGARHQTRTNHMAATTGNNTNATNAASGTVTDALNSANNTSQSSSIHRSHRGHMQTHTASNASSNSGQQSSMAGQQSSMTGSLDQMTQGFGASHRGHSHSGMQHGIQHTGTQHTGMQQSSASMSSQGVTNMMSANMSSNFFGAPAAPAHTQSHRHNVQSAPSASGSLGSAPSNSTHTHHHTGHAR